MMRLIKCSDTLNSQEQFPDSNNSLHFSQYSINSLSYILSDCASLITQQILTSSGVFGTNFEYS